MGTYDSFRPPRGRTFARSALPFVVVLLAALLAGCSGGVDRSPGASRPSERGRASVSTSPSTEASPRPMSQHRLEKLDRFLDEVELLDRIPPGFELRDVDYTSPTDAVAYFVDPGINDRGTIIATTDDNWTHAARIRISDELADLVDYAPLGQGAVAIKAMDQFPRRTFPPFVFYPDGEVKPLRVGEPQPLGADHEVLGMGVDNLFGLMTEVPAGLWAADVDAAEIFPTTAPLSPSGYVSQYLPGRGGTMMNVLEYRHGVGDGVWRFEISADSGRSWQRTDVSLPLGRRSLAWYADVTTHAVGPGHRQAIAMSHAWEDLPLYMWELWWTDDEEEFRRVRLPWDRLRFGGMAFASDGALLLAEVGGSDHYCDQLTCNRPGRIWRLASGESVPELVPEAPRLFGPFWSVGIHFSGGLILARTGMRTIALSKDGHTWTEVTPGR